MREIIQDQLLKEWEGERMKQVAELCKWEKHMNSICSDHARLSVENFTDLALPPMEFQYINHSQVCVILYISGPEMAK